MIAKVALQASSWYNEATKMIVSGGAVNTPDRIYLFGRYIMDIVPQKVCSACNNPFPATSEFFYRDKRRKDGCANPCKACRREQDQQPERRERKLAYLKAYHQTPSGKASDQASANRPENRKNKRIRDKARRSTPEYLAQQRIYLKAYYRTPVAHERIRAQQKVYSSTPEAKELKRANDLRLYSQPGWHERARVHNHTRRARKKAAPGRHTVQDIRNQYERQKGKCYWCSNKLAKYEIDHIVPLSRGGSNWPDNLVIACPGCNRSRNNKLPHEFFDGGRLL